MSKLSKMSKKKIRLIRVGRGRLYSDRDIKIKVSAQQAHRPGVILEPWPFPEYRYFQYFNMDGPSPRCRGWCWTINNPTTADDQELMGLREKVQYYVYGKETGDNNTPHYQGYLYFPNPQRFNTIKNCLSRAHIEPQRGSICQAIEYCQKDGNWNEWGQRPEERSASQKVLWSWILSKARDGDLESIELKHPRIYFQYYEKLKSFAKPITRILTTLENEWWYGPTGTGKSREIWQTYPEHYKKRISKWWDGYHRQDVVVIEEWSPAYYMLADQLKIWSDRYPFAAEIKNGNLQGIRPSKIIVTSNYSIEQCFPKPEDHLPLMRRFKVRHFHSNAPAVHPEYNLPNLIEDEEVQSFIQDLVDQM